MSEEDIGLIGGGTIKSQSVSRYQLLRQLADAYDKLATLEGLPDETAPCGIRSTRPHSY